MAALRAALGDEAYCWGTTASGQPAHPLYLSAAVKLERWSWETSRTYAGLAEAVA